MEKKYLKEIIKRVELNSRTISSDLLVGAFKSRLKGTGMIPADLRQYNDSDDARSIDWAASSRAGQVMVRTAEEDKRIDLILLIDAGEGISLGGYSESERVSTSELVYTIAYAAMRVNSPVGYTLYGEDVIKERKPKLHTKPLHATIDQIMYGKPTKGASSLISALNYIISSIHKKSMIVIVSDFLCKEDFADKLKQVAFRHDTIGIMLNIEPPHLPNGGIVNLYDPKTKSEVQVSSDNLNEMFDSAVRFQNKITDLFVRSGAEIAPIDMNDTMALQLARFFNRRRH